MKLHENEKQRKPLWCEFRDFCSQNFAKNEGFNIAIS